MTTDKIWTLYLLYHAVARRTYLGVTTDLPRRLRQHRGEIVGGARFTSRIREGFPSGQWVIALALTGFTSQSSVTRWERLLKLKSRGLKPRQEAILALAGGKHPPGWKPHLIAKYEVPPGLTLVAGDL